MIRFAAALLCALLPWTLAAAQSISIPPPVSFSVDDLDRSVDACADFYQFACGGWLQRHPLPPDRARLRRSSDLADRNDLVVRSILERAAVERSGRTVKEQQIGDYYASCMDEATRDSKGGMPLAPLLRDVNGVRDRAGLLMTATRLVAQGFPTFLNLDAEPDPADSSVFVATLWEGSLGLPDRELYLGTDERSATLRREYGAHIERMFRLLGESSSEASTTEHAVMEVETLLARAAYDRVTMRDPRKRANPMTVEELSRLGPAIDFQAFFRTVGAPPFTRLNVIHPDYVGALNTALMAAPIESWKAYLRWRIVSALAPRLSNAFESERFRFTGTILSGQQEMRPRWKRCVDSVAGTPEDDQLGEIAGEIFIKEQFGTDAQTRMRNLIAALERSLGRSIQSLGWMTPATKERALEKLKAINHKIGGPEKWRDFSGVGIRRTDYVGNTLNVQRDTVRRQLRWIGQKVDRGLWLMTPQTVNAYFAPPLNEIVFPAGILQPPYFDVRQDDAVNFGAIGAAVGHELSHGFDDQGRKYDVRGNLSDWWTPQDDKSFRERAACVSTQYGGFTAVNATKLNGELTLGENIADNAGVRIAYDALMEVLATREPPQMTDGFTPSQRFFLSWAQLWCENASDEDFNRRAREDNHATGRWRANGVLQNFDEFRKAFDCRTGAPMAPVTVCRVP